MDKAALPRHDAPLNYDLSATIGERVVRLPTAARRKVCNCSNAAQANAGYAFRQANPWRGEHLFPSQREAARRIRELRAMTPGPAVNIARRLVDDVGSEEAHATLSLIKAALAQGDPIAREVHDLLERTTGRTLGEHEDFVSALERLDGISLNIR